MHKSVLISVTEQLCIFVNIEYVLYILAHLEMCEINHQALYR